MTSTGNARIAGLSFLVYIAAGMANVALFARATSGSGPGAELASIARHVTELRLTILLGLVSSLCALALAVTLHAITRAQDRDLAMLALACRVAEGIGGMSTETQRLIWLATATGAGAPPPVAAQAIAAVLLQPQTFGPSAAFFAVGSTLFSWLLLRGRLIPGALARLGLGASTLLVVAIPLELAGLFPGLNDARALSWLRWLPMLVFEVCLAFWFLAKGVAVRRPRTWGVRSSV